MQEMLMETSHLEVFQNNAENTRIWFIFILNNVVQRIWLSPSVLANKTNSWDSSQDWVNVQLSTREQAETNKPILFLS